MTKTLHVIDPFFIAELGDTFELDADGTTYSLNKHEEFYKAGDAKTNEVQSSFSSTFTISKDYAELLVKDGYLEEDGEKENKKFVNIFDEIDHLIQDYNNQLENVYTEDAPRCVQVEKETVLNNLITMLTHLKNLKK